MLTNSLEYQYTINRILIVDDSVDRALETFLKNDGYQVSVAVDGRDGLELFDETEPDLVIFAPRTETKDELFGQICALKPHIPKLILADSDHSDTISRALNAGGWDFILKPIRNFDLLKYKIEQLADKASLTFQNMFYRERLEQLVEQRIVAAQSPIIEAQKELVSRLGDLLETCVQKMENHIHRVARIAEFLALEYGLDPFEANIIRMAAPLHDIGKTCIPDVVLDRDGKLVDNEFEIVKTHTTIGYEMLKDSKQPTIQAAALIALQHHEHWDGSGYPQGLAGDNIHIYGRITCLADVYDVLLQKCQHKESWKQERALEYVRLHSGVFFDPDLVGIFLKQIDKINDIVSTHNLTGCRLNARMGN